MVIESQMIYYVILGLAVAVGVVLAVFQYSDSRRGEVLRGIVYSDENIEQRPLLPKNIELDAAKSALSPVLAILSVLPRYRRNSNPSGDFMKSLQLALETLFIKHCQEKYTVWKQVVPQNFQGPKGIPAIVRIELFIENNLSKDFSENAQSLWQRVLGFLAAIHRPDKSWHYAYLLAAHTAMIYGNYYSKTLSEGWISLVKAKDRLKPYEDFVQKMLLYLRHLVDDASTSDYRLQDHQDMCQAIDSSELFTPEQLQVSQNKLHPLHDLTPHQLHGLTPKEAKYTV